MKLNKTLVRHGGHSQKNIPCCEDEERNISNEQYLWLKMHAGYSPLFLIDLLNLIMYFSRGYTHSIGVSIDYLTVPYMYAHFCLPVYVPGHKKGNGKQTTRFKCMAFCTLQ